MSDGNFNRCLLPHTPYHSGLQAGKSMARMKAIEAFKEYLIQSGQSADENVMKHEIERFKQILSEKL